MSTATGQHGTSDAGVGWPDPPPTDSDGLGWPREEQETR